MLEKLKSYFSEYINDDIYVYKHSLNWILILEKLGSTRTNESRDVYDSHYAPYRASELKVVKIFDRFNPDLTTNMIINNEFNGEKLTYEVGKTVSSVFDGNTKEIHTFGIRYYKTLDRVYYLFRPENVNYTGVWYDWSITGSLVLECNYVNGILNGYYLHYDWESGTKLEEGHYENGKKVGVWYIWENNKIIKVDINEYSADRIRERYRT
uniref:Uncharacterized protein n=1 Tax=viral metagenome TaxID=1070528 RepID=A0A6C0EBY0_9ZZZZ